MPFIVALTHGLIQEWPSLLKGLGMGAVVLGLLRYLWPWLSGRFPRFTALLPHLLVGVGLLGVILSLFGVGVYGLSRLWLERDNHWHAWVQRMPQLDMLDWLWPWFPTLLVLFLLLLMAAVTLSRRLFQFAALVTLASLLLGVVLHHDIEASAFPSAVVFAPEQFRLLESNCRQATEQLSPEFGLAYLSGVLSGSCAVEASPARWTWGAPSSQEPLANYPYTVPQLVGERFATRVLGATFHRRSVQADVITAIVFFGILLLGFNGLDRINLRRTLQPIRVACIEEGRDADGKPRSRADLENLMRECLHRNAPHTPPPLPGGSLGYWQDFVEQQFVKDSHWLTRAAAFFMRLVRPPSGLEIHGSLIPEQPGPDGTATHGIRVHMIDLRSGQILLARSFKSRTSLEQAVEQAAYAAVERAIEQCRALPEWSYWEEADGSALWNYHQGASKLQEDSGDMEKVDEALESLQEAAKKSPGSAMVRLQLAEALEARGDYVSAIEIYLQIGDRYPRLMVAKFRLASVCRTADLWVRRLDEQSREPRTRLLHALDGELARALRKPTRLGWLIERERRRAGKSTETLELEDALLNMAVRAQKKIEKFARWSVLRWFFLPTAERRFFWHTLLWPPQRRRDQQLSFRIARRCAEWRQLRRLMQLYLRRMPVPGATSHAYRSLSFHLLRLRKRWYRFTIDRAATQAARAARIRPNWLGGANYHLACLYSVRLARKVNELPRHFPATRDWWWLPTVNEHLSEERPIQALFREYALMVPSLMTLARSADRARHDYLADDNSGSTTANTAQELGLRALSRLVEGAADFGKLLPDPEKLHSLAARKRALERHYLQELQKARQAAVHFGELCDLASGLQLRIQDRFLEQTCGASWLAQYLLCTAMLALDVPLGAIVRGMGPLTRDFTEWIHASESGTGPGDSLKEIRKLSRQAAALRARLDEVQFLLHVHGGVLEEQEDMRRALREFRTQIEVLSRSILDLRDLHRLVTRLRLMNTALESLRLLCERAHRVQELSQWACEHLSHSMRDRDGPFAPGTRKWLLRYADLTALRPQQNFRIWAQVALREDLNAVLY